VADVVTIGNAALYHGDCREVLPGLPRHDLLLTDPPYGIGLKNHDSTGLYRSNRDWTIANDHDLQAALDVSEFADSRGMVVAMFCSPDLPIPGKWRNRLVWHKHGLGMGGDPTTCWRRDWELILVRGNGSLAGGRDSAVLRYDIRPSEFEHPCQKPVTLLVYLLQKIGGRTVLDPFMGSGTTGVACAQLGKAFTGIERERKYFDIACERISRAQAQGTLLPPEPPRECVQEGLL
jgi:site-specific DNA-methyltransferase (adenine-specific)